MLGLVVGEEAMTRRRLTKDEMICSCGTALNHKTAYRRTRSSTGLKPDCKQCSQDAVALWRYRKDPKLDQRILRTKHLLNLMKIATEA